MLMASPSGRPSVCRISSWPALLAVRLYGTTAVEKILSHERWGKAANIQSEHKGLDKWLKSNME
jgi:hypothetical protein